MDGLIDPRGWTEWSGNYGLSTLYYGEYNNSGDGASTKERVKWPGFHVLNGAEDAMPFTVSRFIQGERNGFLLVVFPSLLEFKRGLTIIKSVIN